MPNGTMVTETTITNEQVEPIMHNYWHRATGGDRISPD